MQFDMPEEQYFFVQEEGSGATLVHAGMDAHWTLEDGGSRNNFFSFKIYLNKKKINILEFYSIKIKKNIYNKILIYE